MGSLSVLNVGKGDIQITFNQHDTDERARAIEMLTDMRRRGYAILLRLEDGTYTRAVDFDAAAGTYIVQLPAEGAVPPGADLVDQAGPKPKRSRSDSARAAWETRRARVPMHRADATAVARSAGG